jgi:predicted DNA-binding transcriptional regulator AlpA
MNPAIPPVCRIEDICRIWQKSRRTFQRLRRQGAFPVPEITPGERHPRWSGAEFEKFLNRQQAAQRPVWGARRQPRDLALVGGR